MTHRFADITFTDSVKSTQEQYGSRLRNERLQTKFGPNDQLTIRKMEVRRVEPWRENSTSIAFYESPSLDGTRPGYYYANLKDMTTYQKSVSTAITYHEGVPGHHFQIALAQELTGLPEFRKHSFYGPTPKAGHCTPSVWLRRWVFIKIL